MNGQAASQDVAASIRKRSGFPDCCHSLAPSRDFFSYDVHRLPGTTRRDCLHASITGVRQWRPLHAVAFEAIRDHVQEHDFPETEEFILDAASEARFEAEESLVYADDFRFHRRYRTQTPCRRALAADR